MIKGLYTAASAMKVNREKMQNVSNNLANVNTNGFKKSVNLQRNFNEMLLSRIDKKNNNEVGTLGTGVENYDTYTNFSNGDLKKTGGKLDIAIQGKGFFTVRTPEGIKYTRNGNFTINNDNNIVDENNNLLLNENDEPINIDTNGEININNDGQIFVNKNLVDNIKTVDFNNYNNLTQVGGNLFELEENGTIIDNSDNKIVQGYLESSNVNIVNEMANMIETTRAYETNQKVIQTMDRSLGKSVNDVGSLR